jgi:hypothetical protein
VTIQYSTVSQLYFVRMHQCDFTSEAPMENWLVAVNQEGGRVEAEAIFTGQHKIMRIKRRYIILGIWCTQGMQYTVQAVLSVCCNRCMLH